MHQQSEKTVGSPTQKLKLADACEPSTMPGSIGEAAQRAASDSSPDPVKEEMHFCDWAFSLLGHVTVFRFSEGGIMLLAENGERARGDTLAAALLAMVEQQGLSNRRLVYPERNDTSRAA
jgi:hypothetical protein